MKKYEAVLFDLDGTLLPMDNDVFVQTYFGLLAKKVASLGYEKEPLISALWKGTAKMVKNDGTKTNAEVFWTVMENVFGKKIYDDISVFDSFYGNEFHGAASVTFPTPLAQKAVDLARECADRVILATNPFFPTVAVRSRLSWANVAPESFDLITTYENSHFCKPNPAYYTEIAEKMGLNPKNCLMVGNNEIEDIAAAQSLGMDTFYLCDYPVSKGEGPETPKGSFEELLAFLHQ
ncbi:MAG: HAD family hydrolase [Clostridia bacterium]|nr:HAD family hydrolase [Clostridia bacterium]